jgi:23S rRNA pseudouridine1911/1915/1917 synthase
MQVLYEDNHLIAVNKPAGVLAQGDETGDAPLAEMVKDYLREKYNKPGNIFAGVIHRLDRPVTGLVLLAKTSKALTRMNALFHERKVQKTYWAISQRSPTPTEGTLHHWLVKDAAKNKTTAHSREVRGSQHAELSYRLLSQSDTRHYLVEVNPLTGRPHQIRVQLSQLGCPILGDLKYGAASPLPDASIALHARSLIFEHPVQKVPVTIIAPIPDTSWWRPFRDRN